MSKKTFQNIRFCPLCGAESLSRDRYGETLQIPKYKNEWICEACGVGFQFSPSLRWSMASSLAKQHREMRPPDERKQKPKPDDTDLYTLQRYGEKIGLRTRIERSSNKPWKFKFMLPDCSTCVGAMNFDRAMIFLRGYEIAGRAQRAAEPNNER